VAPALVQVKYSFAFSKLAAAPVRQKEHFTKRLYEKARSKIADRYRWSSITTRDALRTGSPLSRHPLLVQAFRSLALPASVARNVSIKAPRPRFR
jgi:hypothetical protein